MRNCTNLREAFRETGASFSFLSRKGALTNHLQSGRWYPSRWSSSCALHELSTGHFSSRQGVSNSVTPCVFVQGVTETMTPLQTLCSHSDDE